MSQQNSIVLKSGEGRKVVIGQNEIFFKATQEQGSANWAMCEYVAAPRFGGPPAHYHKVMEEAFYVLDGEISVRLNDEIIAGNKGSFIYIPTNVVHTFANNTDQPASLLIWISPPGFEKYFLELEELIRSEGTFPPKDMTKFHALMAKYDTHFPGK